MSSSSEIGSGNHGRHSSQSEDDEESLSLCDLPLLPTASDREGDDDDGKRRENGEQSEEKTAAAAAAKNVDVSDDFDFCSLVASLDALESEMCAADDVFYRGQILPFRHSVSSASAAGVSSNLTRIVSRSESMDRIVESGFRSSSTGSSSRSSSTRSSSINSSASASKLSQSHALNCSSNSFYNSSHKRSLKVRNQFHSFPSPRPYARGPTGPRTSTSSNPSTKKSPLWEIFRLGLVRTPEIELEDLKFRYGKNQIQSRGTLDAMLMNRSDSSSESRSSGNGKNGMKHSLQEDLKKRKKKERRNVRSSEKSGAMSLISSCKCSVGAVEPEKAGGEKAVVVEKQREVEKQRKQDMSRHHRTFEWLKDLSHAVVLNDV